MMNLKMGKYLNMEACIEGMEGSPLAILQMMMDLDLSSVFKINDY